MSQSRSPLRHLRRRPSAAMGVAVVALFLAIGGVGYAATSIPNNSISNAMLKNNSVGNVKLRSNAVSYKKIAPGSVGTVRIDQQEVQERVSGTCPAGTQAITAISQKGTVTCGATLPAEYDSGTGTSVALTSPTTAATVATYSLPGGTSYLVQSDPYVKVTPDTTGVAGQPVTVSCTLAAGTSTTATQTREVTLDATATGAVQYASIPLEVTEPSSANSTTADVTCTETSTTGSTPTVAATATVYAVQTASNNTVSTPAVKVH
jgi:hypothetical protein